MTGATVGLLDEHRLFRAALAQTLRSAGSYRVSLEAEDAPSGIRACAAGTPDVLVVSSTLPGGGPAAVCRATQNSARILVLGETDDHATLMAALEAGAQGYLSWDAALEEFLASLEAVRQGHASVPAAMLGGLLHDLVVRRRAPAEGTADAFRLSQREREVLALLAQGLGHGAIAEQLVISPQTARTHIQNVLGKMKVHSRVEAVALARERGIVEAS